MTKMKLIIQLKSDLSIARETLTKTQLFFYTIKHSLIKEPIFLAIKAKLSKDYEVKSEKDSVTMIMDSTEEICKKEKKQLEEFMFSDESQLKKSEFYKETNNNRNVRQYVKKIKQKIKQKKEEMTTKLLGKSNIIGWLNGVGIFVTWRLEDG